MKNSTPPLLLLLTLAVALSLQAIAQSDPQAAPVVASPAPSAVSPSASTSGARPVAVDLLPVLSQLQAATQAIAGDLSRLHIDRWKADAAQKQQAEHNVGSITRNLGGTLPGLVDQVRRDPQSVASAFQLYRNIGALYDVTASVAESAGAFGAKADYQALAHSLSQLDGVRRDFAERLQQMAAGNDAELRRLRTEAARAAAPPPPPRKIIVDDSERPAKPVRKKKKPAEAAKPPAPPAPTEGKQ